MGRKKKYTSQFKAKVAFEAAKADKTISQIASEYGLHPQQVRAWKRKFLNNVHSIFENDGKINELKERLDKAYETIESLEAKVNLLSKKAIKLISRNERIKIIKNEARLHGISVNRACELLQIPKSSFYYKKKGESEENKKIMEMIEEEYSKDPTVGYRKMTEILRKKIGKPINKKRVRRLMRKLGLKGIFPKVVVSCRHYL